MYRSSYYIYHYKLSIAQVKKWFRDAGDGSLVDDPHIKIISEDHRHVSLTALCAVSATWRTFLYLNKNANT